MMQTRTKLLMTLATVATALLSASCSGLHAADTDLIPPQLPKEQRENLRRFLQQQETPSRFIPAGARLVGSRPPGVDTRREGAAGKAIKQYMVQIISHRPVPGQEEVKQVDVYYYRPNPEKGKPGITIRHTVDLTTGNQVGPTEVLFNSHTPLSREELAEAVALAREKSSAVEELYKQHEKNAVRWEYLQPVISRPHGAHEPGDRVARFVFTASAGKDQAPPAPVKVFVNLTKGIVESDAR
jgi:hypothetical protein